MEKIHENISHPQTKPTTLYYTRTYYVHRYMKEYDIDNIVCVYSLLLQLVPHTLTQSSELSQKPTYYTSLVIYKNAKHV